MSKLKSELIDNSSCYLKERAIFEVNKCLNCPNPLCVKGCPIHNDIPNILNAIKNEDFIHAYLLLKENTCMPDICGLICPHERQCLGYCVKSKIGDGVNFGIVERFISEYAYENNLEKIDKNIINKRVACIGSGPASLSFVLMMAKAGYKVTIFEKENKLGGLLYYGIPNFRLDKKYLDRFIENLQKYNVEVKTNIEVGKDIKLSEIISSYDGVFIGTGSQVQNTLQNMDINHKYVVFAGDFLHLYNDNDNTKDVVNCGENVVVIGGGNAAIDAARSAKRLNNVKSVKILYRRSEKEMPAYQSEFNKAKEEGIEFITLINPVKFVYKNDKLESVECAIMKLGEIDGSGRPRPVESNEPHKFIKADTVILALGSSNEVSFLTDTDIKINDKKLIVVNDKNKTSNDKVYAGGDIVRGPLNVVSAMKDGMNAAKNLDKELRK